MKNLTEKALLVSLTISNWSARKYDNKATRTVNEEYSAKDAGRFNKALIARDNLKEITEIIGKARRFHYENTLPWNDSGERLLPITQYMNYCSDLSIIKSEFETVVNNFVLHYPTMIAEAQQQLGDLFNENDYPKIVRDKFDMKSNFAPVPDTEDIRVKLSPVEIEHLKEQIGQDINDRFATAQRDIYERVIEKLKYMFDRLSDKKGTFRDSLFENIKTLVELIPKLNIANDPNIDAMCVELNALYVDPETVRKNTKLRGQKALEVKELMDKMSMFKM